MVGIFKDLGDMGRRPMTDDRQRKGVWKASAWFLILSLRAIAAPAQEYRFAVTDMQVALTVNRDSSVALAYEVSFQADPGAHAIDVVDFGMPNEHYRLDTAEADIGGEPLSDIRRSEYVHPGVEVHLGGRQIEGGEGGTVRLRIFVDNLVFQDSSDAAYASLEFKTTWFDPKFVSGNAAQILVVFYLPEGTTPQTVRFHDFGQSGYRPSHSRFSEADRRVSYEWAWFDVPADKPYAAGASFPKSLVARVYAPPKISLGRAFENMISAFFAFVGGLAPVWIPVLIVILAIRSNRRRMRQYLAPIVGIETGGIKRGLTAPEAALLQQLPLPKVLLLIIFGLVRKGALSVREVGEKEYHFQAKSPEPGVELRDYEAALIAAIDGNNRLDKGKLKGLFTDMIRALEAKMAGFSRRQTNAYYRSIMDRAWEQVKKTPGDMLPQKLADSLEWLVMDEHYDEKMGGTFPDTVFFPGSGPYWYQSLPRFPGTTKGGPLSQLATRFAQSLESFSSVLVGNVGSFTSTVTRVTNPPPARTSGGSSGGGGGCACACACAGCACACAGGGR